MSEPIDRLERYLEDEDGECRTEDLERRLEELSALETEADAAVLEVDVPVLAALANETRYKIVRLLVAADEELSVCEIGTVLDVSQSAISHALAQLHEAGLIDRRKDGKWRKYTPTRRSIALVSVLDGTRQERRDASNGAPLEG
ncbi:ArsR/SmtB family transcription factor [Natrialbaceae archaeon GCM10025810]|uniref:ArsR/SmtB family transcription factor n=1 Tax=Halovalidus salilacus TaxID=3075124 RepID=UPI0036062C68